MNGGPRPPVPGLIPLAALCRRPGRPRRSIDEDAADAAADATATGSRCLETRAAPITAPGRRRHHHRRRRASSAVSKQSRSLSPALERPPRVNPIFVWVRQEDTRIVDVKCEDYDKRNRILLTKTAHGWRAIPRTETLTAPRGSGEESFSIPQESSGHQHKHHHHHHHHHKRRGRKAAKVSHSASVQFPETDSGVEPPWLTTENVNIESLLPSHTIQVKRMSSPSSGNVVAASTESVNSGSEQELPRTDPECSTPDKICDVSPLDNLLAVAELELKQHMESGNWNSLPAPSALNHNLDKFEETHQNNSQQELSENIEKSIGSESSYHDDDDEMSMNDILSRLEQSLQSPQAFDSENHFGEDTEPSEQCKDNHDVTINNKNESAENKYADFSDVQIIEQIANDPPPEDFKTKCENLPEVCETEVNAHVDLIECKSETPNIHNTDLEINDQIVNNEICIEPKNLAENDEIILDQESQDINKTKSEDDAKTTNNESECTITTSEDTFVEAESSTPANESLPLIEQEKCKSEFEECLDLSIKKPTEKPLELSILEDSNEEPTDLSVKKLPGSPKLQPQRPPSQSSEAIQSPQPSGIPAIPASPDIVSTTTSILKGKSIFLESLLANTATKISCEDNIKEASKLLDLGQSRKSASPTVTCSEEIINLEPPLKKLKCDDITLKSLLDKEESNIAESPDTPRLLSLLKASSDTEDPLEEYKQLLLEIDIPNPLMVPKDVFPDLLKHPRREILKILSGHTNKNVALDDILVVYKDKLLAALEGSKKNSAKNDKPRENIKSSVKISSKVVSEIPNKRKSENSKTAGVTENKACLASDIDAANEAAFNPLFWAGYPNPFEMMSNYSNQNDFLQALYAASSLPYLSTQLNELHPGLQMMLGNKVSSPVGFPHIPPINLNNPLEVSMWQEAVMQANMLKSRTSYENAMNLVNIKPNIPKKPQCQDNLGKYNPRIASRHSKDAPTSQSISSSIILPTYSQAGLSNSSNWQNSYLGFGSFPQTTQSSNNLTLDTQFPYSTHKSSKQQQLSPPNIQKKMRESVVSSQYADREKKLQQHILQERQKAQQHQKMLRQQQQQFLQQQQHQLFRQSSSIEKQLFSPVERRGNSFPPFGFSKELVLEKGSNEFQKGSAIDLSNVQNGMQSRGKSDYSPYKTNNVTASAKSLIEDIPEVGSTTGGLEEMPDGHSQLWHPLFGNQTKGYSPWNLPSLAAMGE
ncbi:uncharacterized protein LOC126740257 [Anthonomus grandis grandis]|uniref:uncharacterized protein LOC126740257 n=1 Tax=Anthonomus grandis grandis TaxID=2921223 RepID=UPI0021669CA2|nr:uncharacterized protein LOC126740257 [Anthonomus grandis grandis]XP_050302156.1 uncharacterized protein LOC126740257 [Anthonomus grandis grandis]